MPISVSLSKLLTLSDISDFKDIMITFSNKDIPALEDMPYQKDQFGLNITLTLIYLVN